MNDLEQLLRESLHDAPTPTPRITDPVGVVERRASRARLRIAGGVVAVAAVAVAAVVVPMQLTHSRGRVTTTGPAPSATLPSPARPTVWKHGSQAIASGGGSLWQLRRSGTARMRVDEVDPANHALRNYWEVENPADFIAYGLNRVWVWGGGDGGYPDGKLQMIDPATSSTRTESLTRQAFNGVAFAGGYAWIATRGQVWQFDPHRGVVAQIDLPGETNQGGIIATADGQVWVQNTRIWLHIDPSKARVVNSTGLLGNIVAPAGGDAIWTWLADDGFVALSTSRLLKYGVEGAVTVRIAAPGPVTAVAGSVADGLYVVAYDTAALERATPTLYYLPPSQIRSGTSLDDHLPSVPGAGPFQLASDGSGGVDYSDGDTAYAWHP